MPLPAVAFTLAWLCLAPAAERFASVQLEAVPHRGDGGGFSAEACLSMALPRLSRSGTADDVFHAVGIDPALGRGATPEELAAALPALGFERAEGSYRLAEDSTGQRAEHFAALHGDLRAGVPTIIALRADSGAARCVLVIGYLQERDVVELHDPIGPEGRARLLPRGELLNRWVTADAEGRPRLVRLPLVPARDPAVFPTPERPTPAEFARHVRRLRARLPEGFHLVIEPPFVVLGDEAPAVVERRAEDTVRWAVNRLRRQYFEKRSPQILDIWLFQDRESYEQHTWDLFRDKPTTPFGYYSPSERALVMNIATGGGTLVHEIVHPLLAVDFPRCPAWFNEGLASLYEQSGERNERIHGYPNWRLPALQEAIREKRLPPLRELCATSMQEFYGQGSGLRYAQARYLCYYLQEEGLLEKYYAAFRDSADDTQGYETLRRVLGEPDMTLWERRFHEFALGLEYRR